jgi:prolyl oligopeptidase
VLIDPNTFSADGTIRLESFALSKNGHLAAYGKTAIPGSDWRDIYVMDVASRQTLPEDVKWVKYSGVAWRGNGFYYSRYPQPEEGHALTRQDRDQKVYYHRVGTPQSADHLVYEDPAHPSFYVDDAPKDRSARPQTPPSHLEESPAPGFDFFDELPERW